MDPYLTIARLQKEITRLKTELAIARGETGDSNEELPDYELERYIVIYLFQIESNRWSMISSQINQMNYVLVISEKLLPHLIFFEYFTAF